MRTARAILLGAYIAAFVSIATTYAYAGGDNCKDKSCCKTKVTKTAKKAKTENQSSEAKKS